MSGRQSTPPQRPCSRGHREQWRQSVEHGGGWACGGCRAPERDLGLDFTDALGGWLPVDVFLARGQRGKSL